MRFSGRLRWAMRGDCERWAVRGECKRRRAGGWTWRRRQASHSNLYSAGRSTLKLWEPEGPRKRRTREHVIADLSVNHVERFVLRCGWTVQRTTHDYGIDLSMETYNAAG